MEGRRLEAPGLPHCAEGELTISLPSGSPADKHSTVNSMRPSSIATKDSILGHRPAAGRVLASQRKAVGLGTW
jgi:hypothetical protein